MIFPPRVKHDWVKKIFFRLFGLGQKYCFDCAVGLSVVALFHILATPAMFPDYILLMLHSEYLAELV